MKAYVDTGFPELDKLEDYLLEKGIPHERSDESDGYFDWHQITVYADNAKTERVWDAICHYGSYGYENKLLEVMGKPFVREDSEDDVCGYLTAEDVIKKLEEQEETYVFTFGWGQINAGHFVRVKAKDSDEARQKMISRFGLEWAFQYTEKGWNEWCDRLRAEGREICLETEIPLLDN